MLMSIDGFRIREHFVNYGYGYSVALQVRWCCGCCAAVELKREAVAIPRPVLSWIAFSPHGTRRCFF